MFGVFGVFGVIDLLEDVFDHFRLFFERSFIICASVCYDTVQLSVDRQHSLFGDFLEWNDEISNAVECNHVNPCVNWLTLDCFAVAFRV